MKALSKQTHNHFYLIFIFLFQTFFTHSQNTVGLIINKGNTQDGYILFSPLYSTSTFLIDKCGKLVHEWTSKHMPGRSVYLLPSGNLLRTAKDFNKVFVLGAGKIELFNWDNELLWDYKISDSLQCQHHDIYPMPNGNILVLVWEKIDRETALAMGRKPDQLGDCIWSEKIVELKPKAKHDADIVWTWRAWDHLIQDADSTKANFGSVRKNPQLININYNAGKDADWLHFNSIAYHPKFNQIIVSNRNFNEIFIIDHSTSLAESAIHKGGKQQRGGDLLYRWGNPATYDSGTKKDQVFYGQHSAHWITKGSPDEGKIMVFNNGIGREAYPNYTPEGCDYSSVYIINPHVTKKGAYRLECGKTFLPAAPFWCYETPVQIDFFSKNVSSAQQLPNGNTLICSGETGNLFEINTKKELVWNYINPIGASGITPQGSIGINNPVFRCWLFDKNFPAFKKHQLIPTKPIEANPKEYNCLESLK